MPERDIDKELFDKASQGVELIHQLLRDCRNAIETELDSGSAAVYVAACELLLEGALKEQKKWRNYWRNRGASTPKEKAHGE